MSIVIRRTCFVKIHCIFQLVYTYYATCPPGACGRDLSPPRGQCLFGSCSCNLPWTSDGCTVELLAPEIESPPNMTTIAESSIYTYQLVLKTVRQCIQNILNILWFNEMFRKALNKVSVKYRNRNTFKYLSMLFC